MDRLVLTADNIYALAYVMNAKYLDFYYVSLSNRGNDNKLWLSENMKKLVEDGILNEDFSGETSIVPEVESLLRPLYFCSKESSLDIDTFGVEYRFHFLDGKITMTKTVEGGFEISAVNTDDISNIVCSLLPSDYSYESEKAIVEFDDSKVSRIFVVKSAELNVKDLVATFVEYNGCVYEEDKNDIVYSVSGADFADKLFRIITEG